MRAKRRRAAFALIVVATSACKKAPPPPPSPKASVSVENGDVLLEKTSLGTVGPNEFLRFDPLYSKLKERRLDWKVRHPGESFPGLYELTAQPHAPCPAMLSVLATGAFAGYPNVTLAVDATKLELPYSIPGPPQIDEVEAPPPDDLFLHFKTDNKVELAWTHCKAKPVQSIAPSELPATLAKHCSRPRCFDSVWVRCEGGALWGVVVTALGDVARSNVSSKKPVSFGARTPACVHPFGYVPWGEEGRDAGAPPFASDAERAKVKLREGELEVDSAHDRALVAKNLSSAWDNVRACVALGWRRNPSLQGRIKMSLHVSRAGEVVRVSQTGSDFPDSDVIRCVGDSYFGRELTPPSTVPSRIVYSVVVAY